MAKNKQLSLISLSACYNLVVKCLLDLNHALCKERFGDVDADSVLFAIKFYESVLDEIQSIINSR